ncbi:40S ribosomal protein S5-1 [Hordeum vulgare]|nr:40S ribosomal protein S5-1 [Hordeum vulgare]
MHEGVLHIHDVEGPKKTGSVEARLEAMEQQVFKYQGLVERGLNTNHMMITEFTNKHKIDANDIGKHLSRLYDRIDHLQAQICDPQNQNSHSFSRFVPSSSSLSQIPSSVTSSFGSRSSFDSTDVDYDEELALRIILERSKVETDGNSGSGPQPHLLRRWSYDAGVGRS